MKDISQINPKKILVMQQRQLGDVVVTTPVFEALRKRFPHAHLALFTEDKCYPLVKHDPNIDDFKLLPKQEKKSFWKQWQLYYQIYQEKYDVIIDLQQLPRCQMATLFSRAKARITFKPRKAYRKLLYTHYPLIKESTTDYISYTKTWFLKPLGIEAEHIQPRLYLLDEEKKEAQAILKEIGITENTPFISLDATHKHNYRRWLYYPELVQKILEAYPDFKIFVLRAPGEEDQVEHLINIDPSRVVMPKKAPSLRHSMACMSYAHYHIGNTSAPQHMALALNVPAMIILSHTAESWHFSPQKKGQAMQLELRVPEEKYLTYAKEHGIDTQINPKKAQFTPNQIPYPELNLSSASQAFELFTKLIEKPYL